VTGLELTDSNADTVLERVRLFPLFPPSVSNHSVHAVVPYSSEAVEVLRRWLLGVQSPLPRLRVGLVL